MTWVPHNKLPSTLASLLVWIIPLISNLYVGVVTLPIVTLPLIVALPDDVIDGQDIAPDDVIVPLIVALPVHVNIEPDIVPPDIAPEHVIDGIVPLIVKLPLIVTLLLNNESPLTSNCLVGLTLFIPT